MSSTTLPTNHKRAAAIVGASIAHLTDEGSADALPPTRVESVDQQTQALYRTIPLALIVESPKNPRKHFDAAKVAQLAESIQSAGLLEPVLVRPIARPDGEHFELASGHRRARAMRLLGAQYIDARVRAMDDRAFLEALTVTNGQREDVNPLEEAEGYRAWMAETGESVTELGLRIGRSTTYLYARLKLLELSPAVREALARELIGLEHALELGKVDEAAQALALSELFNLSPKALVSAAGGDAPVEADDDAGDVFAWEEDTDEDAAGDAMGEVKASLRKSHQESRRFAVKTYHPYARPTSAAVRSFFAEKVYVQLARAPFDTTDATLLVSAGACGSCPKRSGAAPGLFPELAGHDVCLDRDCYQDKVAAHVSRVVEAEREGLPHLAVVRISSEYSKPPRGVLSARMYDVIATATKGCGCGVYVDGPRVGTAVWIRVAAEQLAQAAAGKVAKPAPDAPPQWKVEEQKREAKKRVAQAVLVDVRQQIAQALEGDIDLADTLRTVAAVLGVQADRDTIPTVVSMLHGAPATKATTFDLLEALSVADTAAVQRALPWLALSTRFLEEPRYDGTIEEAVYVLGECCGVDVAALVKDAGKARAKAAKAAA